MPVGRGHEARFFRRFSRLPYAQPWKVADRGHVMSEGDSDFRIRPGRIRTTRAPKAKSFLNQVLRAAKKAGHTAAPVSGRRASDYGRSTFGRGRGSFSRSRLFSSTRRVIVKARV